MIVRKISARGRSTEPIGLRRVNATAFQPAFNLFLICFPFLFKFLLVIYFGEAGENRPLQNSRRISASVASPRKEDSPIDNNHHFTHVNAILQQLSKFQH